MEKNIVLLSDGTGNAASSPHKTNVWRMYKALDLSPEKSKKHQQLVFYDDGVGTSGFLPTRLIGLAFGWGLKKNVKELYLNLCRVYEPEDNIYIFGFSRGAFTARVVAALICTQGIVRHDGDEKKLRKKVDAAYINFRLEGFGLAFFYMPFWVVYKFIYSKKSKLPSGKTSSNGDEKPLIKMIGVWDTVDAYGAPFDELTDAWDRVIWPLSAKDRDLSHKVGAAYQALALDEQRETFNPMLWNETPNPKNKTQILEQVWFAGVHANLGGGYPDDSLAHVSLNWMVKKSKAQGLHFISDKLANYRHAQDPNGKIYNNRSGFGNIYRYAPRKVEELCNDQEKTIQSRVSTRISYINTIKNIVRVDYPKIHATVFDRIKNSGDGYAPIGLPEHYCVVDDEGNQSFPEDDASQLNETDHQQCGLETATQAKQRRDRQGALWKKIWLGKILYIITILAGIAYLIYPFLLSKTRTQQKSQLTDIIDPIVGDAGEVIQLAPKAIGLIPGLGLAGDWADGYRNHPYEFVFGAIFLLTLLFVAKLLYRSIRENMRLNWAHLSKHGVKTQLSPNRWTKYFDSRLRYNGKKKELILSPLDKLQRFVRKGIELVFVAILFSIVCIGCWKLIDLVGDGLKRFTF